MDHPANKILWLIDKEIAIDLLSWAYGASHKAFGPRRKTNFRNLAFRATTTISSNAPELHLTLSQCERAPNCNLLTGEVMFNLRHGA